ncbi:MAG TPA: hypothetical protein VH134_05075 [Candidatus Dormibacteraeota bacterium]|nr:hypothetical protein [Candidatus Dormibacteraeota bacterium]
MNVALVAAVVALVAATAALGTCVALRALPAEMPPDLYRIARICGGALGGGLGCVLGLSVLVQVAGLSAGRTVALDVLLGAVLVGMVAEHALFSRWLRMRWLLTPGAVLPPALPGDRLARWLRPPLGMAGLAVVFAAVLIPAAVLDPDLPRWTLLFGLASLGQGLGICLLAVRPARRRTA